MYIRASSAIQQKFINSASVTVQPKRSTSRFGVSKTLRFWSQFYVIIAYIINFQVQSTPGQIQIKFTLYNVHIWYMPMNQLDCGIEESVLDICVTGTVRYRSQSAGLVIQVKS